MRATIGAASHPKLSLRVSVNLNRVVIPGIFALLYASFLAALPIDVFKDRHNYLRYAELSDQIAQSYAALNLRTLLSNEPIWLFINAALSSFFSPATVVRIIIFISAFVVSFLLVRRNSKHALWMMIFLLGPQVVKNFIIHLRQGCAFSIFLAGYFAGPRWLRISLMAAAGFIHSSFIIIGAIGVTVWTTKILRVPLAVRVALFSASFTVIAFSLNSVAIQLGARQGERYLDATATTSGFGLLLWLSILALLILQSTLFLKEHSFAIAVLIFYVVGYQLTPLAARIFESGLFLVLIAGLALGGWRRQAFVGIMLFYTVYLYWIRLDLPWLGWGYA